MKEFTAPKMSVVTFDQSDVIASSTVRCDGDCPSQCDFVCEECTCRVVAG